MAGPRSTMIDWDLAVLTASKMAGPGPAVTPTEAADAVEELRSGAARSTPLVGDFTGLRAGDIRTATPAGDAPVSGPTGAVARREAPAPVLVVDRPGWIQANVDGFATVVSPLVDKLRARRGAPSPVAEAVGSRVTGLELGALLGYMSGKVLGQFDPFYTGGVDGPTASGRLLLVAPNIVHAERELEVDSADFRLWVCLHEETHRVQFTAVPWMRAHVHGEIAALVDSVEVDPARLAAMVGEGAKRLADMLRGDDEVSLLDLVQTPAQREVLDRITAVMSLLEGHADVVMDGVGPEVIASVAEIRRKFDKRRKGRGGLDRVLRRLLGFDAKMAQYRDGARFVRRVVDRVGMDGFNQVWSGPEALPSRSEIGEPDAWVRRVHG